MIVMEGVLIYMVAGSISGIAAAGSSLGSMKASLRSQIPS